MSAAIGMDLFPTESWRDLYQTAIHEADLTKLPKRIADAETALVIRARDLFYASGDKIEEEESLDHAMCILHALRSSLRHRSTSIQRNTDVDWLKRA